MSHIVKGTVSVQYTDFDLLKSALAHLGIVAEREPLYRVGPGYTSERYDLVLIDPQDPQRRLGYNREGEVWVQYQEDYGQYGAWTRQISSKIQDRYIALHYQRNLKEEGFNCTITELHDGSLELVAEESVW